MTQISGVVSLFFITMAFLTSCNQPDTPKGDVSKAFIILHE